MEEEVGKEELMGVLARIDKLIMENRSAMDMLREDTKISKDKNAELLDKIANKGESIPAQLTFAYPDTGVVSSHSSGTLELNYEAGTITGVTGIVTDMEYSLDSQDYDFIRSLNIWVDKPVIAKLSNNLKFPVSKRKWFTISYQQFKTLEITMTEATDLLVIASTNPKAALEGEERENINFQILPNIQSTSHQYEGDAWVEKAPKLGAETHILSLEVFNGKLYGGTHPNGKLYEWNGTDAWVEKAPKPGAETQILSLEVFNGKLYGGTYPNGKLYEWNGTDAWVEKAPKLGAETQILSLEVFNGKLYGGTVPNGKLYEWNGTDAWVEKAPKLGAETYIQALEVFNGKLYGGTYPNGKLYEWNGTDAWVEKAPKLGAETEIRALEVFNGKLYGGTHPNGKLYEWNGTDAWVEKAPKLGAETQILSLEVFNGKLYGGTVPNGKLYEWNGTDAWVEKAPKLGAETQIQALEVFNGKLYGGTYPNGKLYEWNIKLWVEDENSAAIKTAVELIDNAIAGAEMQVDIVTSALPAGAATGAKQDILETTLNNIEKATKAVGTDSLLVHDLINDVTIYPVGGDLTVDGVQHGVAVDTTTVNTDVEVLSYNFVPKATGIISWVYFELVASFRAVSTATADLIWKWQARDAGGTWVDLHTAVTETDIGAAYVEKTRKGYFKPVANFDAVPFDLRLILQCNEANEGRGKVKTASYVRAVFKES